MGAKGKRKREIGGKAKKRKQGGVTKAALEVGKASKPEEMIVKVGQLFYEIDLGRSKPFTEEERGEEEEEVQIPLKCLSTTRHRSDDLFALFGLKLKYTAEGHRSRNLHCTVTIDDCQWGGGSQDIYSGILPKPKKDDEDADGFIELELTGPNKFIDARRDLFIIVAIYDVKDPKSIRPPAPHNCGGLCQRYDIACGSYQLMNNRTTDAMLIWCWSPDMIPYEQVRLHNLIYVGDREPDWLPSIALNSLRYDKEHLSQQLEQLENPGSPCSLILSGAALREALFAKEVKVEVRESLRSSVVMVKAVIVKEGFGEQTILLFQNHKNVEFYGKCASSSNIIKSKGRPRVHLVPLKLSRSSVTLPSGPSLLIVKVLLGDPVTKEVVEHTAKFPARVGNCGSKIGTDDIAVTVVWEDWVYW